MTHNAAAIGACIDAFVFPMPIYSENGNELCGYYEKRGLRQFVREGLVTGHGPKHRIKTVRFVAGTRELMRRLRMVTPKDAKKIPIAGDVVVAYKDQRLKYRRSGLPKAFGPVRTVFADGRSMEEKVTPVDL